MGQELRSWERLKPTEIMALLSDGCKKAVHRTFAHAPNNVKSGERTDELTDIDRIKHWIGTTEILSRWDKSCALGSA